MYRLLALMRSPVALRDLMLQPVRTDYIGQEKPIDPAELPKGAAELYPDIRVSELDVPSPLGRIRCQVFSPPGAAARRAMMLYAHGGGFTLGQSEDTAYITRRKTGWWWSASTAASHPNGRSRRASMIASSYCNGCRRTKPWSV